MNRLVELVKAGQSVWIDYIERDFVRNGGLRSLIEKGVTGLTSNPTIFQKAIEKGHVYDKDIETLKNKGHTAEKIFEELAVTDIRDAADLFLPVYEKSGGKDGYVSLEVDPALAHKSEETHQEALRLYEKTDRKNLMIKIPATAAGIPAIEKTIAAGVNVNVTLIFDLATYRRVAEAYMRGLENYTGKDIGKIASVASFFISRIDKAIDPLLLRQGQEKLTGKVAIANARAAYAEFHYLVGQPQWQSLAKKGANVQRLLWASTSTKNPEYPDTYYVDNLVGRDTVNTLPPETLEKFLDHGSIDHVLNKDDQEAKEIVQQTSREKELDVYARLQKEGVEAFYQSYSSVLESIDDKITGK
ncbi:transaldolase [candidate division KSB1 bacterium]|nr:transaldolase [candidate division KSB1 bacterium]